METITKTPVEDLIKVGRRFANAGQTLTIDLVRRTLDQMSYGGRGEEIIDIEEDDQPQEIDLLRRRSVM